MEDDSRELDSSTIFKQEADQLTTVQDFDDALSRYGFTRDDKMSRRELVNIHNQIKGAMEPEIFRLANAGRYAEAKEMRARLTKLRAAFDDLQLSAASNSRAEQQSLFERGSSELTKKLQHSHQQSLAELEETFHKATSTHELYQTIQSTNLEQTISKIHRPNVRYSKRLIELFKAEYNLNKLKQYDEAIKVRRMIDKQLPIEEKKFYDEFESSINRKREKLAQQQAYEQNRLEEKLKTVQWNDIRRREMETKMYTLCHLLLYFIV